MDEEIWKDIPEHEGFYQASSYGRIRSVDRVVRGESTYHGKPARFFKRMNGKVLKGYVHKGYCSVTLSRGSTRLVRSVHELVAFTFLGARPPNFHTHHRNEDTLDNRPENLVYMSEHDHINFHLAGEKMHMAILKDHQVREIRRLLGEGVSGLKLGRMYGVSHRTIYCIKNHQTWKHIE